MQTREAGGGSVIIIIIDPINATAMTACATNSSGGDSGADNGVITDLYCICCS